MAAGLGFKTFTTGEVLTAADTNGYLMQGVLVFASAAARNAAITSPQEGQFAYTKDTNGLWYYDGAAWVASGATGDIEGVTAGVGITGGGTSGTVTITNDMATTITAAGDIVVGTGSGTYDNLPIGTTNQILTADTTVSPYKVKWATAAGASSSFSLISTTTLSSGSSASITGLSGYNQLFILVVGASSTAAEAYMRMRINGDTGSNYKNAGFYITNATGTTERSSTSDSLIYLNVMGTSAGETMSAGITINGANSSGVKTVFANGGQTTSNGGKTYVTSNVYIGSSVVSSFSIFMDAGTFDSGTIYTYGSAI